MEDLKILNKSVFIKRIKSLVVTDLHLGYEESLNEEGVFLPKQQYQKMREELKEIFNKTGKLKEIIILGDFKHKFNSITNSEWKVVFDFIDFLHENCEKIVITRGNHDVIIDPLKRKEFIEIKEVYIKEEYAFLHGDKEYPEIYNKNIKKIFIGHLHPSVKLEKNAKIEKYKCFLFGKLKDKELIILPSFFPLVEGADLEDHNLAMRVNLKEFRVYIPVDVDEVLDFGKLKNLD